MDAEDAVERAKQKVENSGLTHKEAAQEIGVSTRTWRKWRSGEQVPTADNLRSLTQWVQLGSDTSQAYSGPSDAERDPQAVAAEEMQDYGTGGYGRPQPPEVNGATAASEFDVERAKQEHKRRFRDKHRRAQKKRSQTIRFDHGPICLVFMGDQHIGAAGTDIDRVFEEQRIVQQTPAAYCWQMGDIVDNMIVGRLKQQNAKPSSPVWEQWKLAEHYLDEWDDRIVAFVGGNHGAWTMQQTQIDYRRDICPNGILFDGDEVRANVTVGAAQFKIKARHRWPGSSIYNQTHFADRARKEDSRYDLYVGAHDHQGALWKEMIHEGERKAGLKVGTYKVHDDYAVEKGFPDHDSSTACAVVMHDDGSFHGMADLHAAQRYMDALYS